MLEFLKLRSDIADLRPEVSVTISHLRDLLDNVKMEEDTCLICSCSILMKMKCITLITDCQIENR